MPLMKKYAVESILYENKGSIVYRAKRIGDHLAVIIKMLKSGEAGQNVTSQLTGEYQILADLSHECIPSIVEIMVLPSQYGIVFQDIGATSLDNLLSSGGLCLRESLEIAVKIIQTLEYLHTKNIIHADVNPKNIVYNSQNKKVQLIDYGYSIINNNLRFYSDISLGTSGNIQYMSPEQTGRTRQRIDFRSDLYSFGMTMYHLLSGKVPFEAKNRYDLIHKQIATTPQSLNTINSDIPKVVSRIVDKLICKQPKMRYGSDQSLLHDFLECLRTLDHNGHIPDFEIDLSEGKLSRVGEHLYGRDDQMALLDEALYQMRGQGPVSILVSGHTGIGKTRLLEEFFIDAQFNAFTVLRTKFELHKVALPYVTFKQLFSQLRSWILTRANEECKIVLSPMSTQILSYLFTELRLVLKSSHSYGIVPVENIGNKLPFAIQELLSAVATKETPIILFLDDLQWADAQSLELIQKGLLNANNPYVHIVGSYRDEEANVNRIKDAFYEKKCVVEIFLEPLLKKDVVKMLEDILEETGSRIHKLANLLHAKTLGNPFYVKTMIEEWIEQKFLVQKKGRWQYALDKIKLHSASSNIVVIINQKFERLTIKQQSYLAYLALFGSRYDKLFTMEMMDTFGYEKEVMQELAEAGFLQLSKNEYAFVHDQIQEHVFHCMNNSVLHSNHLKIGIYLEHAYQKGEFTDLNSVVYHLNHGYVKGKFPKKLFSLNIISLQEIMNNHSYDIALKRIKWIDEHLFREELWTQNRRDAYRYTQLKCRILYLNGLHNKALDCIQFLISVARTMNERLECFREFKNICVTQGKNFKPLIDYADTLLDELGIVVPRKISLLNELLEALNYTIVSNPLFKNAKGVLALPVTHKLKYQQVASILIDYWEAAYYLADVKRMQWSYLTIIAQSFAHGNTTESAFAYVLLGGQLVSAKEYKRGYTFGDLALKLNKQFKDEVMYPKVHNFMANFINPYTKPLKTNIAIYKKSLQQSKINGDIVFGTWANFLMLFSDFLSGYSLEEFHNNVALNSDFILASGDRKMIEIFHILTRHAQTLQQTIPYDHGEDDDILQRWQVNKFYPALAWYAILMAQTCLLKGDFEEGLEYCSKYVHTTANEVIMFPKIRLHFIRALLLMGKNEALSYNEKEMLKGDIAECESFIDGASNHFKFGKLLLKAEQIKGTASTWEVARLYDDIIKVAQELKNPFYLALGALCASRFWESMFYSDLGRFYRNEAIVGLNKWGAYALAMDITGMISPMQYLKSGDSTLSSSYNSSSGETEPANFQALLDTFYAISKTLDSTQLITILMHKILENATASRGILILKEENHYYTKASIDFTHESIEMCGLLLHECPLIPQKVIQYALNTGENVFLENPLTSEVFGSDIYLQTYKPASCAAITIVVERVVIAILYLENKSVSTPLSLESVRTLELIMTHATIIFKNTLLYETLAKNTEELNKAQEIAHLGSWKFNASSGAIDWSAEVYRIYELIPFSEIIDYDWFIAHLHPEDISLVIDGVDKALNGKRSYNVRHRILTVQGNVKIVHQKGQTYWEDGVQKMSGTIQDVSDSEEAKEQISRLSQVVFQNPFSTIMTDKEGVIQYVNSKAVSMTGYFETELMGKRMSIFNSGKHPKEFYGHLWDTISIQKQMWRGTIINRMKNGTLLDCSSTIFPIMNGNNEVTNFVTIQEDVTQQNIKDKLFMMQSRQAQMGEMLSMIAHQWRQPLSVISSLMNKQRVDIALQQHSVDGFMQSIYDVDTQVQYLSRTISDFRDFFKPDKEKTATTTENLVGKTLGLIGHTLKNEQVTISQTHLHDEPYAIYEHEMVQVIMNLFKNAQDVFNERKIDNREIIIASDQHDDQCIITVEDNGGGIDPNVIDTLFLPYVSTKTQQNGTGLGLYMSKTIVEEHCHGKLSVENTQNGAKFTITLPMKDNDGTL